MIKKKKISIVTVCFNADSTIRATLESVANQTYRNIEYLIIDGGSKDNTMEIVKAFEGNIHKVVSEPDKGLYDAMNKGIALATGDYIGILNSDDIFFNTNTIAQIADCLEKNEGIDAITGDIVQHNGKRILRKYSSKKWKPEKLKIGFMPPHPSIFFKRSLFKEYGNYNLKYKIGADYDLITRFFLLNNISYVYSGVTTTSMLRGGASSSGIKSYNRITTEICQLLYNNRISFSPLKVRLRVIWKILEFLK